MSSAISVAEAQKLKIPGRSKMGKWDLIGAIRKARYEKNPSLKQPNIAVALLIGAVIGLLSGLVGVGGRL